MLRITGIVLACLFLALPAQARQRHAAARMDPSCNITMPCIAPMSDADVVESARVARGKYIARVVGIGGVAPKPRRAMEPRTERTGSSQIVEHPAGCPRSAFCGCGAALHVFGHHVRELWLAANWFRFPRTAWAPGVAGVRPHHVFIVEQVLGKGKVLAYDANSGGHATRVHVISTAGYVSVQPRT